MNGSRGVLVLPPELEYLPGLYLPDLERATLLGAWLSTRGRDECRLVIDDSPTASEAAARLRANGVARATVAAVPDDVAAAILAAACARAGIAPAQPVAITELIAAGSLVAVDAGSRPPFVVVDRGVPPPPWTIAFERAGDGVLERRSDGALPSIPGWARRIVTLSPGRPDRASWDDPAALVAVGLDASAPPDALIQEIRGRVAPDRIRLRCATPAGDRRAASGARFGMRLGLHDPAIASRAAALVDGVLPGLLAPLRTVIRWCRTGIDPLEEMYAGNGIVERTPEMIANVVR